MAANFGLSVETVTHLKDFGPIITLTDALVKWQFDKRIPLESNAFDPRKELQSKEIQEARNEAWKFIQQHPEATYQTIRVGCEHTEDTRPLGM